MRVSLSAAAPFLLAAVAGCGSFDAPPPPAPYKAAIVVHGDPGRPVEGATVTLGDAKPLLTNAEGRVELVLRGAEGDVREAKVQCPPGHQAIQGSVRVRLTRLAGTQIPEYQLACPPLRRSVVVAVRAENGPYLPVKYLNQVVATTDEMGAAHFRLEIEPGSFSVALDTSERQDLKPPSPAKIMTVGQEDDILVFDQKFEVKKKKIIIKKPTMPKDISRRGS